MEEYRFQSKKLPNSENVVKALACLSKREGFFQALARQLVVVEDDLFAHLCRHGTPVTAHVRLDSQTKTVASRGLWYEETLPPETLLYVALSASRARRRVKDDQGKDLGPMPMSASKVLQVVTGELLGQHPYLQLGGNETLGMGWCRVTPIEAS